MDAFLSPKKSSTPATGAASKLLANLPSRGLFSSTVSSPILGGMRVYICAHDTSPPEDQLIKTNQTNILIRSLMLKNEGSRKRPAERAADGRALSKRPVTNQTGSGQGASNSRVPEFQCLTVDKLRALLKEKGLSQRGRKDELVARLKSASSQ